MSQLQKAIARIQRPQGPRLGFGPVLREQPRAMLAGVVAGSADAVRAAIAGGADVVVVTGLEGKAIASAVNGLDKGVAVVGARLDLLTATDLTELERAGCDFVVSSLSGTAAAAIGGADRTGNVIALSGEVSDTTLRALAPLGLEALWVEVGPGEMSLAGQLELVRLATFTVTPLLVAVSGPMEPAELRVLRDSGAAGVLLPAGSSADAIYALGTALKAVPPPRKQRRDSDHALVPASKAAEHEHDHDDDDD